MSHPKPHRVKQFYKSGTPITTIPNPRAGIIKGSTTRKPPTESSPEPPLPTALLQCRFDANKERRAAAEAAYGKAMTADPNDIGRIEEYLASQYQKVLLVKKAGAKSAPLLPPNYPFATVINVAGKTTISTDPSQDLGQETQPAIAQVQETRPELPENGKTPQMQEDENNNNDAQLESDKTNLPPENPASGE